MKKLIKHPKICITDPKKFKLKNFKTNEKLHFKNEKNLKKELEDHKDEIAECQELLYAQDKYSVLLVLQAIDAAGKDSCIKHVLSGINPQGCHVSNFKTPSKLELDHDYLWRTYLQMPERGKIGVFNRSYYEEVLVCKVHPEFVLGQNIPHIQTLKDIDKKFWKKRYQSINDMEKHLVENGTIILKVFLNLSKDEQRNRFIERIDNPEKRWKFSFNDLKERELWNDYQVAYEDMIRETSTEIAPWYVVPADDQWVSRAIVGRLLMEQLQELNLHYPIVSDEEVAQMQEAKKALLSEK